MAETNYSLKDQLFNRETVTELSRTLEGVYEGFEGDQFIEKCLKGFDDRELKARMSFIRQCLEEDLPEDYMAATEIMLKACRETKERGQFTYGAFCEYIEMNGCHKDRLAHSLKMLGAYTKILSAEYAVRRFLNDFPEETFEQMMAWAQSGDVDQRRLASEGLRAKLPWAKGITFDPIRATGPLNYLYDDDERYVTRSVANHLNDLSKTHPDAVIDLLTQWSKTDKQSPKEMAYILKHSTRTLLKKGYPGALKLLGYSEKPLIDLTDLRVLNSEIHLGQTLEFECTIKPHEDTKLMIDYVIDYPMSKGGRSQKVFKLKTCLVEKGKWLVIQKKHPLRMMTTKKLYPGTYRVQLQINGSLSSAASFTLIT